MNKEIGIACALPNLAFVDQRVGRIVDDLSPVSSVIWIGSFMLSFYLIRAKWNFGLTY